MAAHLSNGLIVDGKFRILRFVAAGGMGHIYEGEVIQGGQRIGIETAPAELCRDAAAVARFNDEVRQATALGQPHIARVVDGGRLPDGGVYVIHGEPLRGQTLGDRLAQLGGRMTIARASHVGRQILEALVAAHPRGIIHRDLNLQNVFLTHQGTDPDWVRILDFGWIRVLTEDPGARAQAASHGAPQPNFMAPEVARRAGGDHRVDIYAVGCLLYRMVTGQLPFTGADVNALLFAVTSGRYVPPRAINQEVTPQFEQILQYGMALDQGHRYQTADHLMQTLAPLAQAVSAAPPPEPLIEVRPPSAQMPVAAAAAQPAPVAAAPVPAQAPGTPAAAVAKPPVTATPPAATPAPPKKAKKGGSKVVPILISLGIAGGVCGGLLLWNRSRYAGATTAPTPTEAKPTEEAKPEDKKPEDKKPEEKKPEEKPVAATPDAAPAATASPDAAATAAASPDAAPTAAASPDAGAVAAKPAATPDAGAVATKPADKPPDKPTEPAAKTATVTVEVTPADAKGLTVTLDGKPVEGGKATINQGAAKLVVKAPGYATVEKKLNVTADVSVPVTLKKAARKPKIEL